METRVLQSKRVPFNGSSILPQSDIIERVMANLPSWTHTHTHTHTHRNNKTEERKKERKKEKMCILDNIICLFFVQVIKLLVF